jgi:hypothetical protein
VLPDTDQVQHCAVCLVFRLSEQPALPQHATRPPPQPSATVRAREPDVDSAVHRDLLRLHVKVYAAIFIISPNGGSVENLFVATTRMDIWRRNLRPQTSTRASTITGHVWCSPLAARALQQERGQKFARYRRSTRAANHAASAARFASVRVRATIRSESCIDGPHPIIRRAACRRGGCGADPQAGPVPSLQTAGQASEDERGRCHHRAHRAHGPRRRWSPTRRVAGDLRLTLMQLMVAGCAADRCHPARSRACSRRGTAMAPARCRGGGPSASACVGTASPGGRIYHAGRCPAGDTASLCDERGTSAHEFTPREGSPRTYRCASSPRMCNGAQSAAYFC